MSLTAQSKSISNAKKLINAGKVSNAPWSFSGADGNALLGENGDDWANYALWHIAEDPAATADTKARFKYPYGKDGQVFRRGVIAAKSRAAQQGEDAVSSAADALLQLIDKKKLDEGMCPECECEMPESGVCPECGYESDACGTKKKTKMASKDNADSVQRWDSVNIPEYMTKAFEIIQPEGFLKGRAIVTSIGVFTYKNADGSTQKELRLPEEVFDPESIETLKMKPMTNLHPTEIVTSENVKKYQVGNTGSNPGSETQWQRADYDYSKMTDGIHLAIDIMIMEAKAISDAQAGRQALSCGYKCELEPAKPGAVWCGMNYDFIQRKIRYNHVAIVDQARAGDAAAIRLDSKDAVMVSNLDTNQNQGDSMDMKKITLDSVEYQAEAPVLVALSKANERADAAENTVKTLTTDKSKLEAERDTQKERADGLAKDLEKAKADAANSMKIGQLLPLLAIANKAGVEVKADSSEEAIQKAIILKAFPKANLDGKDAAYMAARFDAAVEHIDANVNLQNSNILNSSPFANMNRDEAVKYDSAAARQRMIARQTAESRGEKYDEGGK